jgi:hypothetical protein
MWTAFVTITSDQARDLLTFMKPQRTLYKNTVALFVDLIRNGEFALTHQGIAFDEEGRLMDGQHRLTACVETGIPIHVMVTFNMPWAVFEALDNGRIRSVADHLFTAHIVDDTRAGTGLSAAGRILHSWDKGLDPTVKDPGRGARAKQIRLALSHHPKLKETVEWCDANVGDRRIQHRAAFAAMLTLFREVDDDKAMAFARQIINSEGIYEGDPAHTLRKTLQPEARNAKNRSAFMHRIVWAWNAFYERRKITKLYSTPVAGGGFPKIAGHPSAKAK